jgi:NitT/TauT family transport system substrate-binding protein
MTARTRTRIARIAAIAGVVSLVAAGTTASSTAAPHGHAAMAKIRIAFSTWNGYAGLVIGVKSGIFKKAGLDVQYSVVEDPVARFNALKAGSLDAIATTPDTFARTYARGIKTVQVLGLDASVGGDGIVADKSISSVKQLKGQKVAVSAGSTSQWFLAYVLSVNHLTLKDVKQVDLTSGDAGAAFAAGRVPVAVTWQPWLDRTKKNPNGHVLVSSRQYPTIITDQVGFTPDFVKKNPETVQAFVRAYGQVMDSIKANPDKAFGYATKYLGQSTAVIKATLKDVPLWTLAQSRAYYGTPAKHGQIYKIFTKAGQFWKTIGEISSVPSPNAAIDPSFLAKA